MKETQELTPSQIVKELDRYIIGQTEAKRAVAIVKAVTHYQDPNILAEVSRNLGEAMVGRNVSTMPEIEKIAGRGW